MLGLAISSLGDRERTPEGMADEALFRCTLYRKGGIEAVRARLMELADEVRANPAAPTWAKEWADHYKRPDSGNSGRSGAL